MGGYTSGVGHPWLGCLLRARRPTRCCDGRPW